MIFVILIALLALNAATALAFAIDKRLAVEGGWRISEATLLTMATLGGSAGAVWARRRFRHKTRKQPFSGNLDAIAALHAAVAVGLAIGLG